MSSDVTIVMNEAGFRELLRSTDMRALLLEAAKPVVEDARASAPRRTGRGAESIHAEAVLGATGWEVRVGWDRAHAYMRFAHSHAIQEALNAHYH